MTILFFGQPASGKTTLAKIIAQQISNAVHIDGDEWRDITKNKDYSKEGRMANLKGAFDMALLLEKKGFTPVLSFVAPYEQMRSYLKQNSVANYQIYLHYSGDVERGRKNYFVVDFEEPTEDSCLLKLCTSELNVDECVNKINTKLRNIYG